MALRITRVHGRIGAPARPPAEGTFWPPEATDGACTAVTAARVADQIRTPAAAPWTRPPTGPCQPTRAQACVGPRTAGITRLDMAPVASVVH